MSARSKALMSWVAVAGCMLALVTVGFPHPVNAVWVKNVGGQLQFQVGGQPTQPTLRSITPTATTFPDTTIIDPTCGPQGGTSLAIVQGSKLAVEHGVDPSVYPIVLVVSCLDNSDSTKRAQLYFLNPADPVNGGGKVVKSIQTSTTISGVLVNPFAPSNGWAHLVHRPDKGDLLGCGNDGTIYRIEYSQFTSTPDGTATFVARPSGLPTNCAALGWDPDNDMIYQGVTGGNSVVGIHRFSEAATPPPDLGFFNLPTCTPSGVAITGDILLVACKTASTILRLDKSSGTILGVNGTLGVLGLAAGTNLNPGLGDLTCDPVTFQINPITGKDQFTDGLWSRLGTNGNGAVALEFPAFTCGLPAKSVVLNSTLGPLSPLAPGLSAPVPNGPGQLPLAVCFDAAGNVKDSDGDGLPDCWETTGIDFDGDGNTDVTLCVPGDTNSDGVPACADPNHKDLFVEINWMVNHKPDPLALSQAQAATSVGVQSVRGAFAAAPVSNPDTFAGIRLHFQVKDSPVMLNTLADAAGTLPSQKEVTELVFTPCTPPGTVINQDGTTTQNVKSLSDAADFDAIKKLNFGTAAEQANQNTLNAKRLAFRYVLFAHNQAGANKLGSTASGCSEVPGDDAAITLGSFSATTVSSCTLPGCTAAIHNRGTTDQQAGTFMHEFGHTLGLRHGGGDNNNCKPNYLSVMSYTRQIAGSPIPSRRLDYSRVQLPTLGLDETSLLEPIGLCPTSSALSCDPSLSPIFPFFPSADQTAFGPTVWSVATANSPSINWSKDKTKQGVAIIEPTPVSGNINQGSGGCDGSGANLVGHDDWHNLLYRASAALEFAGGVHTVTSSPNAAGQSEHVDLTKDQADALFLAADLDVNGIGDAQDCGTFPDGTTSFCPSHQVGKLPPEPICPLPDGSRPFCSTHRVDIKPSAPADSTGAKTISLGTEATVTIAIFAEVNPSSQIPVAGNGLWDPTVEVITACPPNSTDCLTFNVETLQFLVKVNQNGQGTCSARDVPDPVTGAKDGFKDLLCQFPTSGLPLGRHTGVVSGFFNDPNCTPVNATCPIKRAFRARQDFVVVQ